MRFLVLIYSLFLLVAAQPAFGQSAEQVLERLIEAYGGAENLRKLDSAIQEWDVQALAGDRQGTDVRSIRVPDGLKVVLSYPQKSEVRILDGDQAHVIFDGVASPVVSKPQRDAMRLQLMRLYSPLVLREKIGAVTLTQEGEFTALSLVEHGVRADYLVNPDEWRIEKVVGTLSIGNTGMQFLTEYSDFTIRDGVLIHQKENKFAGGVNTARLRLRNITFDADLGDDTFTP